MPDNHNIAAMRKVYHLKSLREEDVNANPIKQFETWWKEAMDSKIDEPNAMTLATSTLSGRPSARIVLLKEIHKDGFVFYTNYNSRKGHEIQNNSFVALLFFWKQLEKQIRVEGKIRKLEARESDNYFATRPRESQLGAWSSPQSSPIESAEFLVENMKKYEKKFQGENVPRPEYWGGYLVEPNVIEFWQGRPGRLHDRLQYSLTGNNQWVINRLAP